MASCFHLDTFCLLYWLELKYENILEGPFNPARISVGPVVEWLRHVTTLCGPGPAKMCLMPYANNKGAGQPAHPHSLISTVEWLRHVTTLCGPGHAKMCPMPYANNKGAGQPAHPRSQISTFVVHCLDSMICILVISQVSRFYLVTNSQRQIFAWCGSCRAIPWGHKSIPQNGNNCFDWVQNNGDWVCFDLGEREVGEWGLERK